MSALQLLKLLCLVRRSWGTWELLVLALLTLYPLQAQAHENKTGVSAQSISVPKGPGTIEGMGESFSAQASTGISTFTVPFALPAARGDAQPSLGLSYSSASGSGVAGIGWSVGVPFIARETDRGVPSFNDPHHRWRAKDG